MVSGVDDGARTHDRRDHNPELYQLSYVHHRRPTLKTLVRQTAPSLVMARPAGLEPATLGLEGRCSIRLSYGRMQAADRIIRVVGAEGFEPPTLCSQSRCATRLRHAPPCSTDRRQAAFDVAVDRGPARERESYGSTPIASI